MEDNQVLRIERTELFSNAMIVKSLCSPRAFARMLRLRDVEPPKPESDRMTWR